MNIYRERAHLVAFMASVYHSHWIVDVNEPQWPVLAIDTPEGQMTWHISGDDLDLFGHVPHSNVGPEWDGHTTEEKYERLRALIKN